MRSRNGGWSVNVSLQEKIDEVLCTRYVQIDNCAAAQWC